MNENSNIAEPIKDDAILAEIKKCLLSNGGYFVVGTQVSCKCGCLLKLRVSDIYVNGDIVDSKVVNENNGKRGFMLTFTYWNILKEIKDELLIKFQLSTNSIYKTFAYRTYKDKGIEEAAKEEGFKKLHQVLKSYGIIESK